MQLGVLVAMGISLAAQSSAVLAMDLGKTGLAIEAVDLVQSLVV